MATIRVWRDGKEVISSFKSQTVRTIAKGPYRCPCGLETMKWRIFSKHSELCDKQRPATTHSSSKHFGIKRKHEETKVPPFANVPPRFVSGGTVSPR